MASSIFATGRHIQLWRGVRAPCTGQSSGVPCNTVTHANGTMLSHRLQWCFIRPMDLPRPLPSESTTAPETAAVKKPPIKTAVKRKFTKKLSVKGKAKALARKSQTKKRLSKR